jgi:hypothetical protein
MYFDIDSGYAARLRSALPRVRDDDHAMLQDAVLDYEQLTAQYQDDLFHLLRGHGSLDYLEIWVPDADHVKSLLNMVEAAQSCGRDHLVVDIAETTMNSIDTSRLRGVLDSFGTVALQPSPHGMRLCVRGLSPAPSNPAYRAALDRRAASLVHAGIPAGDEWSSGVHVTADGVTLSARLDQHQFVLAAAHDGASGDVRLALDVMCSTMIGRPLQEAAEHGAIRLEAALRDPVQRPPLAGIINPTAAAPFFGPIEQLVRALFETYIRDNRARPKINVYVDCPHPAWTLLSPEMQLQGVSATIRSALVAAGVRSDDARVTAIEHNDKVMIVFRESISALEKGCLALALERALTAKCDPTLQVFLVDLKDGNAARRL